MASPQRSMSDQRVDDKSGSEEVPIEFRSVQKSGEVKEHDKIEI